jgi:hypothetical protein
MFPDAELAAQFHVFTPGCEIPMLIAPQGGVASSKSRRPLQISGKTAAIFSQKHISCQALRLRQTSDEEPHDRIRRCHRRTIRHGTWMLARRRARQATNRRPASRMLPSQSSLKRKPEVVPRSGSAIYPVHLSLKADGLSCLGQSCAILAAGRDTFSTRIIYRPRHELLARKLPPLQSVARAYIPDASMRSRCMP